MSASADDHNMGGVEDPATADKGKGKAPQPEAMEESGDDDSSDESGPEDQAQEAEPEEEDNMEEIDSSNIVGSRTRGKEIDFAKAAQDLGDDDDEDDDDDFNDPDDEMKD